ncbi:MAG TPA: flagellar basal body L-ring protein FlgH [Candidatus Acidoferrum sp.]|nr:flagellar basal body L-ring protein FlgH [Candidatus Acidoferrum sp.]
MKNKKRFLSKLVIGTALAVLLPALAHADSLWLDGTSRPMFADKRAMNVGDIVTIMVQENSSANKNNSTTSERQSSLSAAITSFLYSPGASGLLTKGGQLPAMAYNSDQKHAGNGTIKDSESIVAEIAVRVIDVLPNGNLVLEGKRDTSFSGEHQTIILRGVVRSEDVAKDNTVLSFNVADATIQIVGKGTVSDSQNKGWFTRLWDKINPF